MAIRINTALKSNNIQKNKRMGRYRVHYGNIICIFCINSNCLAVNSFYVLLIICEMLLLHNQHFTCKNFYKMLCFLSGITMITVNKAYLKNSDTVSTGLIWNGLKFKFILYIILN